MNNTLKFSLVILVVGLAVGGLVYKAMNPSDYQDPRHRTSG